MYALNGCAYRKQIHIGPCGVSLSININNQCIIKIGTSMDSFGVYGIMYNAYYIMHNAFTKFMLNKTNAHGALWGVIFDGKSQLILIINA